MMNAYFKISLLAGLTVLLLLALTGCDGVSGPRGPVGDQGDPGDNYVPPVPANRFFSLAITNNSQRSHNGAPKLYLAFDGLHQAAGDTVVSQRLAAGQTPAIDGVDNGTAEWGDKVTNVTLYRAAGDFNFIEGAQVRSAYDNEFVYFQVKWTEVANATYGLEVSRSDNPNPWVYPAAGTGDNVGRWDKGTSNEDRLNLFFEITPVTRYASDGCYVTCHTTNMNETNYHATRGPRERMDIWHWTAGTTNHTGYGYDRYLDASLIGVKPDIGTPVVRSNREFIAAGADTTDRPLYMALGDPNSNSGYPLWDFAITGVANEGWTPGATIPAFVNSIPTLSSADLIAVGQYDNGTWTVELKRKRVTGNGDDATF